MFVISDCGAEIYFPSDTYDYLLSEDTQVNTTIAEVIALFANQSSQQDSLYIVYSLEAVRLEGNCSAKYNFNSPIDLLFAIEDNRNGKVVLTEELNPFDDYIGKMSRFMEQTSTLEAILVLICILCTRVLLLIKIFTVWFLNSHDVSLVAVFLLLYRVVIML